MAYPAKGGSLSVSLSDLIDEQAASAPSLDDSAVKAATLREQLAKETAMKEQRAAIAIERMEKKDQQLKKARERADNSGVPLCEEGVWGSGNTGLLSATACRRERDGMVEKKSSSGFMVVF